MKIAPEVQIVKGMRDIGIQNSALWLKVEDCLRKNFEQFAYQAIRTPILEKTSLFKRSVGINTDIVEKEMFAFSDQGGDEICLRPELTAPIVRSLIENGQLRSLPIKTWSIGPAFRRERPQKGRYRQFHQADVEAFGISKIDIEIEMILLCQKIFDQLGIKNLQLQINTLGDSKDRIKHKKALVDYFKANYNKLDIDSQKRLSTNPLRILDSKNSSLKTLINQAPKLIDFVNQESKQKFNYWQKGLKKLAIDYVINPNLVRGLDYYNQSVFEWVVKDDQLGAGNTICGGGRYDYLVDTIVEKSTEKIPAIGFAIGIDRLVLLLEKQINEHPLDIFIINADPSSLESSFQGIELMKQIIDHRADLNIENHLSDKKINKQFEKAKKSAANLIITINDPKLIEQGKTNTLMIKAKNQENSQIVDIKDLINWLEQNYAKKN